MRLVDQIIDYFMATHDLVYKDEAFRIVGAAMAVHRSWDVVFWRQSMPRHLNWS